MAGTFWNPCCCWNLKDGCITVGIWSLIFSIAQLGIFGWQIAAIKYYKDRAGNNLLPVYGSYDVYDTRFPGYYERYYESPEERFYTALFIVQILALIASFFLLFASVSLIYGIHTNSKHLVWPWFPCMIAVMLCSVTYCVIWWTGDIRGYWLVLTLIEIISVIVNYMRIVKGIEEPDTERWRKYSDYYHYGHEPTTKQDMVYIDEPRAHKPKVAPIEHHVLESQESQAAFWNPAYTTDPTQEPILYTHQEQAAELPVKAPAPLADPNFQQHETVVGSPEGDYTQKWIEKVMESSQDLRGGPNVQVASEPASPTKLGRTEGQSRLLSKSVPSVHADPEFTKKDRRDNRHHRRHRSSSVGSRRSHKSRKSSDRSSSSPDTDDSGDDRSRRRSQHRHHRSHSRDKYSESDWDARESRSERSDRHKHRSSGHKRGHRGRGKDREDRERESKSKRSRRPRDVKREDKERLEAKTEGPPPIPPRPNSAGTDQMSWPPYKSPAPPYTSPGGAAAAITIPQHIVIPPTVQGGKGHGGNPRRFQINSEITISYSDRSTVPSDSEAARKAHSGPRITAIPGPTVISPTDGEDGEPQVENRMSYGAESSDSKGHGSTAV